MPTQQEIYKYIMRIEGEEEVNRVAAAVALAEQKFQALYGTLGQSDPATKAAAAQLAAVRIQLDGMNQTLHASRGASRGAAQAFLELSRGIEDFTVAGPLGALNNLPRVVGGIAQAFKATAPQVAAVEATASALGTTAYIVYQNWGRIKKLFDDGLSPKLLDDVKSATEALQELTQKEWTTRINVRDFDIAK